MNWISFFLWSMLIAVAVIIIGVSAGIGYFVFKVLKEAANIYTEELKRQSITGKERR